MRRSLILSVVLLAGCGGSTAPGPQPATVPTEAVVRWLEAVERGAVAEVDATTVDDSLAIVLALENGMDVPQLADMVTDGIPAEMAESFWRSFAAEFVEFAGRPLSTLRVGDYSELDSQGATYAAVTVTGRSDASATVFTRLESDGGWAVDLVATLGTGFLEVMSRTYDGLPDTEDGGRVREAYRDVVAPSLWAALAVGGTGDEFARDALGLLERIDAG